MRRRTKNPRLEPSEDLKKRFAEVIDAAKIEIIQEVAKTSYREPMWRIIASGVVASLIAAFIWWLMTAQHQNVNENAIAKFERVTYF